MKGIIYIVSLVMILTGCASTNQETTGSSNNEESTETTSPTIDLADFEATLEVNSTEEEVMFTIHLQNKSNEPTDLTFSSGQKFEIVVRNAEGKEVYRFSKGRMFTMALETLKLDAGEKLTFEDKWDYQTNGEKVQPGNYSVVATVIPIEVNGEKTDEGAFKAEESFTLEEIAQSQSSKEEDTSEADKDTKNKENVAFRNIEATGSNGEYVIKGEARVFEAVFLYAVEDGHNQLIQETPFFADEGAPSWSEFELKISIPKDQLPTNATLTAHIYERSAKDDSIVNSYFVTLEKF
ncbi:BsuPI-related putative proteinase inhibitor [Bacillus sp. AK128]